MTQHSFFNYPLVKDNSFRIHHCNLQKLTAETFKKKTNIFTKKRDIAKSTND